MEARTRHCTLTRSVHGSSNAVPTLHLTITPCPPTLQGEGSPLIFSDGMRDWDARKRWTMDYLAKRFGRRVAHTHPP